MRSWKRMYAGGGELTENIDDVGGAGTAEFASKAIDIFWACGHFFRPLCLYSFYNLED